MGYKLSYSLCGISSLLDILWTVVSGSIAPVIGVSLRFTSSIPKQSNSAEDILVHSNRLWVLLVAPNNSHPTQEIHGICMGYKMSSGLCVECHHYLIFYGLLFLGLLLQ